MPQEDQSELTVMLEMPEGFSLEGTEQYTLRLAKKLEKVPGVLAVIPQSMQMLNRVTMSHMTLLIEPPEKRGTIQEVGAKVRAVMLPEFALARPRVSFPNALGGRDTFAPTSAPLIGALDFTKTQ